ncbi:MAG: STN domain-containing protein [Parabacteroides sp.]|nr:STN domain-containing protein [Parabacteroides sp.]
MKLSVVFSFLLASQLYAGVSYSQTATVSLSLKNVTVEQALDRIERETGFSFLFRDNTVDVNRIVNLKVNKGDINKVLSQMFDNTNVDYKVVDKQIILSRKAMAGTMQ